MQKTEINIQSRLLEVLVSLTAQKNRLLHCVISQELLIMMNALPDIYIQDCFTDDEDTLRVPLIVEQYVADHILDDWQSIYMYELVNVYELTKMRYELIHKKSTTE